MSGEKVGQKFFKRESKLIQLIKKYFTYHNIYYQQIFLHMFKASKNLYMKKSLPFLAVFFIEQKALADRLAQAALSANSHLLTIAQATSGIAFALGAIFYHFGAPLMGKQILIGGVIGLAATFGGPAMIELLRSVFNA